MDAAVTNSYKQNWWMYLVSGIVTLLFGLVTIMNPALTFLSLSFFFGLFLVMVGVIDFVGALTSRSRSLWWLQLVLGSLVTLFGVYILQRPGLSLATFVVYVALALLVKAVQYAVEAFESGLSGGHRALLVIAAAASALASVFVWRYPVKGTLAFVWVLGIFALVNGPLLIAFAIEAKNGFKNK